MIIKFSMDGIKDMDLLYTWVQCEDEAFGTGTEEHYHGCDYCKNVVTDTISTFDDWNYEYQGALNRVANEVFTIKASDGKDYTVSFTISTYENRIARLECTIEVNDTTDYDQNAEKLKIALKDRLIQDWDICTWLTDDQSVALCRTAYKRASEVENNLRAFASKVLIHFLGNRWIKRAGLDEFDADVSKREQSFTQRVPEFDNINTDFLSMTLETLARVITEGKVYKEELILSRQDYKKIQELGAKGKVFAASVSNYISGKRTLEKDIWNDIFVQYLYDPERFKNAITDFISGRNHIAHSKVLSWRAYQIMLSDFERMDSEITRADEYYEDSETAEEVFATIAAEEQDDEEEYYRDRLASETGLNILNETEIRKWFSDVLRNLYTEIYQRYHLDSRFELSEFSGISDTEPCFMVQKANDARKCIIISASSIEDDELGGDSVCSIICMDFKEEELFSATVSFHNGDGYENDDGVMEPTEDTIYDNSEIPELQGEIIEYIENNFERLQENKDGL